MTLSTINLGGIAPANDYVAPMQTFEVNGNSDYALTFIDNDSAQAQGYFSFGFHLTEPESAVITTSNSYGFFSRDGLITTDASVGAALSWPMLNNGISNYWYGGSGGQANLVPGLYEWTIQATGTQGNFNGDVYTVNADFAPLSVDPLVVSIHDTSVSEGASGSKPLTFDLTLNHAFDSGSLTANIDLQPDNYPLKYKNAVEGTDWFGAQSTNPLKATVTFNPGETHAAFSVNVKGDTLIEPNERLTAKISSIDDHTNGKALIDLTGHDAAIGTILNDDGPPLHVNINWIGAFDSKMEALLQDDFDAAAGRIQKGLGANAHLPSIDLNVGMAALDISPETGNTILAGTRETSIITRGFGYEGKVAVPQLLYEALTGHETAGLPDATMYLNSALIDMYYTGRIDAPDMTTVISHELLHAMGISAPSLDSHSTPWDLLTSDTNAGKIFTGVNAGSLGYQILLTGDGHMAVSTASDLMNASPGINTPVSPLDLAMLHDLGYGGFTPSWKGSGAVAHAPVIGTSTSPLYAAQMEHGSDVPGAAATDVVGNTGSASTVIDAVVLAGLHKADLTASDFHLLI